jgi:hypothetical protein
MVSKITLIAIVVFSFVGCQSKTPAFVKEQKKYIPIAADLYLMQTAIEQTPPDLKDSLAAYYLNSICSIYKIEIKDIENLYEDLSTHPNHAVVFYDSLTEYMKFRQQIKLDQSPIE